MYKRMLSEKGITLIALILTVVIMLILAGVTFNAIAGDNGILEKAMRANNATEEAHI